MTEKILPCKCDNKRCRKRKITAGVFKFKEIRCALCGQHTQGEYTWLSDDGPVIREWNEINKPD